MAKGIEIGIASETKAFKQGLDVGVIAPLEDAQTALEALGDSNSPEQLERNLKSAATATERLEDETRDTARAIEREYKEAYATLKRSAETGFHGARAASGAFKQEAVQNFSEVTSSFNGSMESVGDLAQGTFGGLAASASAISGPVGIAVGLLAGAAAAGIGLVTNAITDAGEATEADQAKVAEWAQSYIEAGQTVLTSAQSTAKGLQIVLDPEQFKAAEQAALDWGVTTATAIAAQSGQQWAIDAVTASVASMNDELEAYANAKTAPTSEEMTAFVDLSYRYDAASSSLTKLNNEIGAGQAQAEVYSQYLREMAENTAGATATIDEFGDSIYALPDGTTIYIDAETGQATQDTDAIANKIYSLPDMTVSINADTTAVDRAIADLLKRTLDLPVRIGVGTFGNKIL